MTHFTKNEKGNDYVVGDIHGCFSRLQEALDEIGFFPRDDRLFSVGDLVDRGPESEKALAWLSKPWFHAIRGNHEQMAIDASEGYYSSRNYSGNGGDWFMALMTKNEHLGFVEAFQKLPLWMTVDTGDGLVGIVHGDCPNDWNKLDEFTDQEFLWGRHRIMHHDDTPVQNITKVYCGHTPVKEKLIIGNVHYIDTGAVFGKEFTIEKL